MGMEITLIPEESPSRNLNECYSKNIRDHFPFPEIRPQQEAALQAVEEVYRTGKKFVIVEAPTGSGKSGCGIAAVSHAKTLPYIEDFQPAGYYLSPIKSLTAQLRQDFESRGLVELKGRANYTCTYFKDEDTGEYLNCDEGGDLCAEIKKRMSELDEEEQERLGPFACTYCPYKSAKEAFINLPMGVTNFAYYLAETSHVGLLPKRNLLTLDEAHNTEQLILGSVSVDITYRRCQDVGLQVTIPTIKPGQTLKAIEWIKETYLPALEKTLHNYKLELDGYDDLTKKEVSKLQKKAKRLIMFRQSLNKFIGDEEVLTEWIVWTDLDKGSPTSGAIIIKPLTAVQFAQDMLFNKARKVLIMSATIGDFDIFMRNLGIPKKDAVCVRLDSDFPLENRPIYYRPVGSMSSTKVTCPDCAGDGCYKCFQSGTVKAIDVTLPKMVKKIEEILNHKNYVNKKGVIHCHTYKIAKYLMANFSPEIRARITTHEGAKDREDAIARHLASSEPSVLLSPSMTEGLDLKDDSSRFSIIVKVPYAPLTPYVKARMERDPDWYAQQAALTIVQATGRSNRHKNDKAHHFILDSAFGYFVGKNEKMFPKYWLDSIIWPRGA
jgi:Rad3-related DNA helicase